jgi:hypothetical protein
MKMIKRKDDEAGRGRRRDIMCVCGHRKHWLKNKQWVCGKCGKVFVEVDVVKGEPVVVEAGRWWEFWK